MGYDCGRSERCQHYSTCRTPRPGFSRTLSSAPPLVLPRKPPVAIGRSSLRQWRRAVANGSEPHTILMGTASLNATLGVEVRSGSSQSIDALLGSQNFNPGEGEDMWVMLTYEEHQAVFKQLCAEDYAEATHENPHGDRRVCAAASRGVVMICHS